MHCSFERYRNVEDGHVDVDDLAFASALSHNFAQKIFKDFAIKIFEIVFKSIPKGLYNLLAGIVTCMYK